MPQPTSPAQRQPRREAPLSARLRETTRERHRAAESASFARALIRGEVNSQAYVQYLAALRVVYTALEEQLARPEFGALPLAELARCGSLGQDLQWFARCRGLTPTGALPAVALDYAERLREMGASTTPERLWAHVYTRYLGDLSGGQIIAQKLGESLELPADDGLSFYSFNQPAALKDRLRAALDGAGETLGELQRQAVLAEARAAFDLNAQLLSVDFERGEGERGPA